MKNILAGAMAAVCMACSLFTTCTATKPINQNTHMPATQPAPEGDTRSEQEAVQVVVASTCGPGCTCGAACNCKSPLECLQVAAASPPAPVSSPALAPALPAATGHYELRSVRVGMRNWQNQWVWIPHQARQPVYQYQTYGGGCATGNCGRR